MEGAMRSLPVSRTEARYGWARPVSSKMVMLAGHLRRGGPLSGRGPMVMRRASGGGMRWRAEGKESRERPPSPVVK